MTPLRLTDSQLHAVRKAAALLRPQARSAFLKTFPESGRRAVWR
jgi:hypothetical protein